MCLICSGVVDTRALVWLTLVRSAGQPGVVDTRALGGPAWLGGPSHHLAPGRANQAKPSCEQQRQSLVGELTSARSAVIQWLLSELDVCRLHA